MRLGADPEVFLKTNRGNHISAIGLIGANKYNPWQVPHLPEGFTLQEDNVALEFGQPPAANEDEFVFNTRRAMLAGLEKLPGKRFSRLSCTVFDEAEMREPMAHIFGCEPDYNAWFKCINERQEPPHPNMRSAGGHIHVELPPLFTEEAIIENVRSMDLYLGIPSVLMDDKTERRKLYGKAGAFRFKPYGFEYRTLSNFWIFNKKLIRWVWRNTERSLNNKIDEVYGSYIQRCINESNETMAKELVTEFKLEIL